MPGTREPRLQMVQLIKLTGALPWLTFPVQPQRSSIAPKKISISTKTRQVQEDKLPLLQGHEH